MASSIISALTALAEGPAVGDLLVLVDISDTTDAGTGTTKKDEARFAVGLVVNAQTGTTYTVLTTDFRKLVTHTNGAAIAVTLPQASATFPAGWFYFVQNRGAGAVTITPTTSTIDGAATLVLNQNEGALIVSDGTNYFTMRGKSAAAGGTISGLTTGTIPQAASSTTLSDSILVQSAADTIKLASTTAKLIFGTAGQPPRFELTTDGGNTAIKLTDAFNSVTFFARTLKSDSGGDSSYYINPDTGIFAGHNTKLGFARNATVSTPGSWFENTSAQRGLFSVKGDFGSGTVGGTFAFTPERPAQITIDKNDYQTATISKYVFLNSDAARNITGWKDTQSPSADFAQDGEERVLVNNGSNNIVLKHENASSTAAFRFHNSTGADITLSADQAADMVYDSTLARWRVFKRN